MNIFKRGAAIAMSAAMLMSALPVFPARAAENTAPSKPTGLLTNELTESLNVEEPTFGWIVNDDDENEVQTAYQIVVKDEITDTTVWDSGAVESPEQSYVAYNGSALENGHPYSWTVKTRDKNNEWSPYSDSAYFATGISDWGDAKWISDGTAGKSSGYDKYWYVKKEQTLTADKTIKKAYAYISGLQDYDLYVNDTEIGRGQSFDYAEESRYQGWDITEAAKKDSANIDITALVRTYGGGQGRAAVDPGFLAYVTVYFMDGTSQTIVSDSGWQISTATPYNTDGTKNGGEGDFVEKYDATRDDKTSWTAATEITAPCEKPIPELSKTTAELVHPVKVERLSDGTTIADFGKVIPARPQVTFSNAIGSTALTIWGGYVLTSEGKVDTSVYASQSTSMRWVYTPKSGEAQVYDAWNHLAFRYLQIPDCGETFTTETIAAKIVHTNVPEGRDSTLVTSNTMLNDVYELMKRSAIYSVQNSFVDTPTREKGQFTDDARNISEATMATSFEREVSKKALDQFMASADRYWTGDEAGRYNSVYPNGDGKRDIPEYSVNFPQFVWNYYMNTGDTAMLTKAYPYIKATANYISDNINESTGLVEKLTGGDGSPNSYQYGIVDWPASGRFGYDWSGTKNGARTTVNMLSKHAFDVVALAAAELGNTTDAADMQSRSETLKTAINNKLITADGTYCDGTTDADGTQSTHISQHANSYALAVDVVTDENKETVADYTASLGMRQGPMTADILVKGLFNSGENTAALKLFTEPNDYGWAYEVANDYTFTFESWDANLLTNEESQSHGWGSTASSDMLKYFAGVQNIEAGAKKIKIAPVYTDLTSLDASVATERGNVGVKYERDDSKFDITITIPVNIEALIELPVIGDGEFKRTNGSAESTTENGVQCFNVGSGTYVFEYEGNITVLPDAVVYNEAPIDTETETYNLVEKLSPNKTSLDAEYKGQNKDLKLTDWAMLHFGTDSTSISSDNGVDLYNDGSYIKITPAYDGTISLDVKMRKSSGSSAASTIYMGTSDSLNDGTALHSTVSTDTALTISDIEVQAGVTYYIYNDAARPTSIKKISYTHTKIPLVGIKGTNDETSKTYTWEIGNSGDEKAYSATSDFIDLTVSLGSGDSMTEGEGIKFTGTAVPESGGVDTTGRYILIEPKYNGTFTITCTCTGSNNRLYYYDFGVGEVDLSQCTKSNGAIAKNGISKNAETTTEINMSAGGKYVIYPYTYNGGSTISALSFKYTDNASYEIPVISDGLEKKYMHISFDDVYSCLKDITDNTYTSIFDNSFFADLKELHDSYGAVFTLNCFIKTTKDSGYDISNLPDKYAAELADNADWLKFAFHAQDDGAIYGPTTATSSGKLETAAETKASYKSFTDAIMKATGNNISSIDTVTRLGFFSGNEENVKALTECDYGITGLLTADDSRVSYYFDTALNNHIIKYGYHYDNDNKLKLIKTQTRLEGNNEGTLSTATLESFDGNMVEIFTHESEYSTVKTALADYIKWARDNNYGFGYAMYLIEPKTTDKPSETDKPSQTDKPDNPTEPPKEDTIKVISENTTDGTIYYTVKNNGAQGGTLIAALYNSDNTLCSVSFKNIEPNASISLTLKAPENAETADVKFMLWDGIGTMKPIAMLEHKYSKKPASTEIPEEASAITLDRQTYPLVVGNASKTDFSDWETRGSSFTLSAVVDSDKYSVADLKWTVEDEETAVIVSSASSGVDNVTVRGKRTGFTKVKAELPDGDSAVCSITVIDNVTRETVETLEFNTDSLTLAPNASAELIPIINPKDVFENGVLNTELTWESSDTSVAAVENGIVTAKSAGTAVITATSQDVGRTAECVVTVSGSAVKSTLSADTKTRDMTVGDTAQLTATGGNIIWRSDNPLVADVDESGLVTAYSNSSVPRVGADGKTVFENGVTVYDKGTVNIYATAIDGGETKVFPISVREFEREVQDVSLNKNEICVAKGDSKTITAAILPASLYSKEVSWSSSNPSVASVKSSGRTVYGLCKAEIQGVGNGTAEITAQYGGRRDTCVVTVTDGSVKVDSVSITNAKTLDIEEVYELNAEVTQNADNSELAWLSGDRNILTVNNEGIVKAYSAGTVKIYAIALDSVSDTAALNELLDERVPDKDKLESVLANAVYDECEISVKESSPYLRNLNIPEEAVTYNSINLLWSKASDMDTEDFKEYKVYCNNILAAEVTTLGYTAKELEPDTEYTFRVEAYNAEDEKVEELSIGARTKQKGVIINVLDYGAKGDGKHMDTLAIQNAINACPENGIVYLPKGYTFYSGALFLKSDMTFKVDGILMGSPYGKDYPPVITRWEGWRKLDQSSDVWANTTSSLPDNHHQYASLINVGVYDEGDTAHTGPFHAENIVICGNGQINGNGFRLGYNEGLNQKTGDGGQPVPMTPAMDQTVRGRTISFNNCENVYMKDVLVAFAPAWTIHPIFSKNLTFDEIELVSRGNGVTGAADDMCILNGDGIDPECSTMVNIFNIDFYTGDDAVALKSGRNKEGNDLKKPTAYVRITDCRANDTKSAFVVGSENACGVHDILFQNLDIGKTMLSQSMWFKTYWSRGGTTEDVIIRDLDHTKRIELSANYATSENNPADELPRYRYITFENCSAPFRFEGLKADGTRAATYIENVTLRGCTGSGTTDYCRNFTIWDVIDQSKWKQTNSENINFMYIGGETSTAIKAKDGAEYVSSVDNEEHTITVVTGTTENQILEDIEPLIPGLNLEYAFDGYVLTVTAQDGVTTASYTVSYATVWSFAEYSEDNQVIPELNDSTTLTESYNGLEIKIVNNNDGSGTVAKGSFDNITDAGVFWRGGIESGTVTRYIAYTPTEAGMLKVTGATTKSSTQTGTWGIYTDADGTQAVTTSQNTSSGVITAECEANTTYYIIPKVRSAKVGKIEYVIK